MQPEEVTRNSNQRPSAFTPAPFNFVDLETKASEYLVKVRAEAAKLLGDTRAEIAALSEKAGKELAKAKSESERVSREVAEFEKRKSEESQVLDAKRREVEESARKEGYERGYQSGYDEGREKGYADGELQASLDYAEKLAREAEIQLAGKLETLLPALQTAVRHIETAQQSFLLHWEQSAIKVAAAIAQRAISRELPEMLDVPLKLLREALELAAGSSQMKVRLNPDDYETLKPQIELLINELAGTAEVEIAPDHKITPGGCVVETSLGKIDQRIESRLDRIQMELV